MNAFSPFALTRRTTLPNHVQNLGTSRCPHGFISPEKYIMSANQISKKRIAIMVALVVVASNLWIVSAVGGAGGAATTEFCKSTEEHQKIAAHGDKSASQDSGDENIGQSTVVLRIKPDAPHRRDSEGDFIQLKDGRIMFVYSHFPGGPGGASDHAPAHLAARFSSDGGRSWTTEGVMVVPNEGKLNVMSVSLLRLQDGRIAMFYLRKNSLTDCCPQLRISTDEGQSWSKPCKVVDEVGYYVLNNDRVIQLQSGRIVVPWPGTISPAKNCLIGDN